MTPCPRIIVHKSEDGQVDAYISAFYLPRIVKGQHIGWARLPLYFSAANRETAIVRAECWWAAEQAKLSNREAGVSRRLATLSAKHERAASDDGNQSVGAL